jgi:trehalose synthase-fused probable maltokinase
MMPLNIGEITMYITVFEVNYAEGNTEHYLLPLSYVPRTEPIEPKAIIAEAEIDEQEVYLIDALYDIRFRATLLQNLGDSQVLRHDNGEFLSVRGKALAETGDLSDLTSIVPPIDSSNSAMIFGGKYFLKLYRKLFREVNPEVEMLEFITENSDFKNIPRFAGSLTWRRSGTPDITLGMMVEMIDNEKDAWSKTGDYLNDFLFSFLGGDFKIKEDIFSKVGLLGKRTAEMHRALFARRGDEAFRSEPFDRTYRRYLHRKFEDLLERRYELLTDNYQKLDTQAQELAWIFMDSKNLIDDFIDQILTRPLESLRTRIHGDYHLGQVLSTTDGDFIIIDFEGEPESSITDRKIKHSPLKDVAGMIRSYHYAVSAKLFNAKETQEYDLKTLEKASDRWYKLIRDTYLEEYFNVFGSPHELFKNNTETNYLLQFHLLEKAIYELGYELNSRPTWVNIPLKGIVEVIREIEKMKN